MRVPLICIALIALAGCRGPASDNAPGGATPSDDVARADATWAEVVSKGQEARAWLARDDTRLFEISKEAGTELVEKLYAAGATTVTMVDSGKLSDDSPVEVGATFVAELPSEVAARKKVFDLHTELMESTDKDEGQKYLAFTTD